MLCSGADEGAVYLLKMVKFLRYRGCQKETATNQKDMCLVYIGTCSIHNKVKLFSNRQSDNYYPLSLYLLTYLPLVSQQAFKPLQELIKSPTDRVLFMKLSKDQHLLISEKIGVYAIWCRVLLPTTSVTFESVCK